MLTESNASLLTFMPDSYVSSSRTQVTASPLSTLVEPIKNQKAQLETYAKQQGFTNIKHYTDDDESERFLDLFCQGIFQKVY